MTFEETMQALESLGTEQFRKTYRRHGMPDPMFGVSSAHLGKLRKQIKTDHALAKALWASGNYDARVLATMVADAKAATVAELDAWAGDIGESHAVAGYLAREVVVHSPHAQAMVAQWLSPGQSLGRAVSGWTLVASLAMQDPALPDAFFTPLIARIEAEIHGAPNRVRDTMNSSLIAIGVRNDALEALALAAAARIGKVEVDHGDTACETPDAADYIRRTRARAASRAAAKAAKPAPKGPRAAKS